MECPNCGAKNALRAKFCRRCALRLESKPAIVSTASAASPDDAMPAASARLNNLVILVVLLLMVALGWYFLRPETSPLPPAGEAASAAASPNDPLPVTQTAAGTLVAPPVEATVKRESPPAQPPTLRAISGQASGPQVSDPKVKPADKPKHKLKVKPVPKPALAKSEPAAEPPSPTPQPAPVAPSPVAKAGLTAELEACSTRAFLAKAICVERARWKFCQGKWGTTSECPKPDNNESGG